MPGDILSQQHFSHKFAFSTRGLLSSGGSQKKKPLVRFQVQQNFSRKSDFSTRVDSTKSRTSMARRPSTTAVRSRGSMVSRPGKPGGGVSLSFSSTLWGAAKTVVLLLIAVTMETSTASCQLRKKEQPKAHTKGITEQNGKLSCRFLIYTLGKIDSTCRTHALKMNTYKKKS